MGILRRALVVFELRCRVQGFFCRVSVDYEVLENGGVGHCWWRLRLRFEIKDIVIGGAKGHLLALRVQSARNSNVVFRSNISTFEQRPADFLEEFLILRTDARNLSPRILIEVDMTN
jgi:hypothetical protein